MNKQSGMGLSEVLISLFLASIIMTSLIQIYLSNKRQYVEAQNALEANFDLLWVSDLMSDSIRRAGFTPCLGIEQLKSIDMRVFKKDIAAIESESSQKQFIQINRMSEVFTDKVSIRSSTELVVSDAILFNEHSPLLLSDCEHAEVHQILKVDKSAKGTVITLTKPLMYSYSASSYLGAWLEEQWFIKTNTQGSNTLHYKLLQTEELTPLVHTLQIQKQSVHQKQMVRVVLGLDKDKSQQIVVAVRGS